MFSVRYDQRGDDDLGKNQSQKLEKLRFELSKRNKKREGERKKEREREVETSEKMESKN